MIVNVQILRMGFFSYSLRQRSFRSCLVSLKHSLVLLLHIYIYYLAFVGLVLHCGTNRVALQTSMAQYLLQTMFPDCVLVMSYV